MCYNGNESAIIVGKSGEKMALENLYQLTMDQWENLPNVLGEAFAEHPLFCHVFPQAEKRKECITFFMTHYLRMVAPYALFLADSEAMNAVMIVYDSRRYSRRDYGKALLQMNVKLAHLMTMIGLRDTWHLIKEWETFSKRWVNDFERHAYFHLEMVYAKADQKQKMDYLIRELVDEGDIMEMNISVKACDKESALWYERMGFTLMNTIVDEESDLRQYCLIAKHHKEQKTWIRNIE